MKIYLIIVNSLMLLFASCSTISNDKATKLVPGHYIGIASLHIKLNSNKIVGVFETSISSNYEMKDCEYCRLLLVDDITNSNSDSVYDFSVFNLSNRDTIFYGGTAQIKKMSDSSVSIFFTENSDIGDFLPCFTQWSIDEPLELHIDKR